MSRVERNFGELRPASPTTRSGESLSDPLADIGPKRNLEPIVTVGGAIAATAIGGGIFGELIVRRRMEQADREIIELIKSGISEENREARRTLLEEIEQARRIRESLGVGGSATTEELLERYNQAYGAGKAK